jgi:uncharacterized protein
VSSDEAREHRRREVDAVARDVAAWASTEADVLAVAMVGSWARDEGGADSDLDLIVLTDVPERFTARDDWLSALGSPPVVRREQFGVVAERRVQLDSGLIVEFGIGPRRWASAAPIDAGTLRVTRQGLRPVFDPDGLLADLLAAAGVAE